MPSPAVDTAGSAPWTSLLAGIISDVRAGREGSGAGGVGTMGRLESVMRLMEQQGAVATASADNSAAAAMSSMDSGINAPTDPRPSLADDSNVLPFPAPSDGVKGGGAAAPEGTATTFRMEMPAPAVPVAPETPAQPRPSALGIVGALPRLDTASDVAGADAGARDPPAPPPAAPPSQAPSQMSSSLPSFQRGIGADAKGDSALPAARRSSHVSAAEATPQKPACPTAPPSRVESNVTAAKDAAPVDGVRTPDTAGKGIGAFGGVHHIRGGPAPLTRVLEGAKSAVQGGGGATAHEAVLSPATWVGRRDYYPVPYHPVAFPEPLRPNPATGTGALPSPVACALQPSPLPAAQEAVLAHHPLPCRDPRLHGVGGAEMNPMQSPTRHRPTPPPPQCILNALLGVTDPPPPASEMAPEGHVVLSPPPLSPPPANDVSLPPPPVDDLRSLALVDRLAHAMPAVFPHRAGCGGGFGPQAVPPPPADRHALLSPSDVGIEGIVSAPVGEVDAVHRSPSIATAVPGRGPGVVVVDASPRGRERSPVASGKLDAVLKHLAGDDGGAKQRRGRSASPGRGSKPPEADSEMDRMREMLREVAQCVKQPQEDAAPICAPATATAFDEYKEHIRNTELRAAARSRHDARAARGTPDPRLAVATARDPSSLHQRTAPVPQSPVRKPPPPPPAGADSIWAPSAPDAPEVPNKRKANRKVTVDVPAPPRAVTDPLATTVHVRKRENEPLGASFDESGVLLAVTPQSVAARHDMGQLVGRRLSAINGQPVRHVTDIPVLGDMVMTFVVDVDPEPRVVVPGPGLLARPPMPLRLPHPRAFPPPPLRDPHLQSPRRGRDNRSKDNGSHDWKTAWAVLLTHLKVQKGVTFEDVYNAEEKDRMRMIRDAHPDSATQRALANTTWLELAALMRRRGGL